MARPDDKFWSEPLSSEQVRAALLALPAVLTSLLGQCKIIANYGWATNIHIDLQYLPMRDDTRFIQYLIEDSIDQRIVEPGKSDFLFEVPEDRLSILFCHESDIHLQGSDDELLKQFMATDPFIEFRWESPGEGHNSKPQATDRAPPSA